MDKNGGYFIVIDGPDGSGKGSVIKSVASWIRKNTSKKVFLTKEPGSPHDHCCLELRKVLLSPGNKIDPMAEFFLYMADRAQHVSEVVLPAMREGKIVISDRYTYSSYAYQGCARGKFSMSFIRQSIKESSINLIPDLSLILMADPEVGLSRITKSEFGKKDRIESESLEFHKRVFYGYSKILEDPIFAEHTIRTIDTSKLNEAEACRKAKDHIIENLDICKFCLK